jgi:hypothetical protein
MGDVPMTTNETPQNADHMMRVCYDQMLATLKTAYSLNPQAFYPEAIEQKLVQWEKAFKDAGCITGPLTAAVTEIDVERRDPDQGCDCGDSFCSSESKGYNRGWNACLDRLLSKYPRVFVDGGK